MPASRCGRRHGSFAAARPDELLPLARAAAEGDPEAGATLVGAVGGSMLRVVRKVLGRGHPDIDDVTQDAVIALLTSLMVFRAECTVEHFANRVALLTALAARRRGRVRARQVAVESESVDEVASDQASPLATTVAARRRMLVRQLLDELPDVIAEALASHFILGYTVEEIAGLVGGSRQHRVEPAASRQAGAAAQAGARRRAGGGDAGGGEVTGAAREDCRGDLLAQGRRGALSSAGKLALDAHLAACATCRTARDVWADFDAVDVVDVRDGARVRALADAVRARSSVRRRAPLPRPWAAAAALLLIAGSSASAAVWLWKRPAAGERARLPAAAMPAREARVRVAHAAPAPQPAAAAAVETPVLARQPAPRRAHAVAAVARRRSTGGRAAGGGREARGQGDTDRATTLYRKLQREYPGTPEAVVSTVPLGRMLLAAGSGRAALAQFDSYLRASARGPLVAEALYGKGQACALLDDVGGERATWQRLLAEHADSPYAPHARRRLAALQP